MSTRGVCKRFDLDSQADVSKDEKETSCRKKAFDVSSVMHWPQSLSIG
jgi:hypothetical protein